MNHASSEDQIPSDGFLNCAIYARLIAELDRLDCPDTMSGDKASSNFATMVNGDGVERLTGCGSVVDSVNSALRNGDFQGLGVQVDDDDNEWIVVTEETPLSRALGGVVTAVTLASGVVAMQLVRVCVYFEKFNEALA